MKKLFQYSIYPLFMILAWALILWAMQTGINQYLATVPIIALFGIVALLLERALPFEKEWINGSDWNLDFTYYIINYLIKVSAQFGFIWLSSYMVFFGWFPTDIPFWIQVILALFIIDFFLFFVHWQSHEHLWLWKLHAIHHSSERLYFLNGEKRHAIHQLLEGGPGIIVCLVIGVPQPVVVAALALLAINMMMQHTNLDYKAGILKKFFCVAELHRWHHRADYKDAQVNYGAWLTIWDHIFKTNYDDPKIYDAQGIGEIGIKEEPDFPKSYVSQMVYPFRKSLQPAKKMFTVVLLLCSSVVFAQGSADDIVGIWKPENGNKRIELYKRDNQYVGKIVYSKTPDEIGKEIIWNLVFDKKQQEWNNGQLQLPEMDHAVDCYVTLEDGSVAKITGYHGWRIFGSSEVYVKLE